jgi:hypothetical protein
MLRTKPDNNRIHFQQEEIHELSQISIESNVATNSKGRFTEDPST